MQRSRFLRFLSIPAALGLGTALVLACSEGVMTSPDQPAFKKGANKGDHPPTFLDDVDGSCRHRYTLTAAPAGSGLEGYDANQSGFICVLTP